MTGRLEYIQSKLAEDKADALMVQTQPNVYYLSGFNTNPHERLVAVVVLKNHPPFIICPAMEVNQVKDIFLAGDIIGYNDTENPWLKISDYLKEKELHIRTVALEKNIPWSRLTEWEKISEGRGFLEADHYLNELRLIKSEEEQIILQEAAALADQGVEAGINALKEGVSEMKVLAAIEYAMKKEGVREMSFSTMVLFGEKGGDPHGNPGSRKLQKGDSVLFDLGVVWKGYCSDITRTVFFDHVKDEHRHIYQTVKEAQQKALDMCKPGQPLSLLDKTARSHIENSGLGEYFPHRIGHGLGIEVHEFPSLSANNDDTLQEGMTFTIEPGIYIPNETGVRIEDDVLITADGYKTLTSFTKELTVVPS